MSNIFIKDISGQNTFAVPASDAALSSATTGIDNIVSAVANLSYDSLLAWVETRDGGSAPRTLNALVQKFTYSSEECPDSTEVQTMTSAIKTALENDADIFSIGDQQVSIFQAPSGGSSDWSRSSGHIYPTVATDDLYIGGATPNGVWFDDGDMVLGGSAMVGTERLRVVGNIRVESNIDLPSASSAIRISAGAGTVANEKIRVVADATVSTVGILAEFSDPSMIGSTYVNVLSKCGAVAGTSYAHTDFKCDPAGGGVGGTRMGFLYPSMTGTNNQGSTAFAQEGWSETNNFRGRTGLGASAVSSITMLVGTTLDPSAQSGSWINIKTARPFFAISSGANWDHIVMEWQAPLTGSQSAGQVNYLHITSPFSNVNVNVSGMKGLYIEDLQFDTSFIYGSTPFGIYQAGASDLNWFSGNVGFGTAKTAPAYDIDAAGDINCDGAFRKSGTAGLSNTYNFGGGASGQIASMTFSGGILTAVTLVP